MVDYLQQSFSVPFQYRVYFTEHLFTPGNTLLQDYFQESNVAAGSKLLVVIDDGVLQQHRNLVQDITSYFQNSTLQLVEDVVIIPGGEGVKNTEAYFHQILDAVNEYGIDRHSYLAVIGGGPVLDVGGYAAAMAHRGIRLLRIPTTVLIAKRFWSGC